MADCVAREEFVQAVRTHSPTLPLETGLSKSPETTALQLARLQQSTQHWAFIFFEKAVTSQSFEALKSDPAMTVEIQFFLTILTFSLNYKTAC